MKTIGFVNLRNQSVQHKLRQTAGKITSSKGLRVIIQGSIFLLLFVTASVLFAGRDVEQTRPVGSFDKIDLQGIGTLRIIQAPDCSLNLKADESLVKILRSKVEAGTLHLYKDPLPIVLTPTDSVVWTVTVPSLSRIHVAGAGKVIADTISGESLELSIDGSGKMSVESIQVGTCTMKTSGNGFFEVMQLNAKQINCSMSGSGAVRVASLTAEDFLTEISGSADINVKGNAKNISIKMSGSARFNALDLICDTVSIKSSGSGKIAVNANSTLSIKSSGSSSIFYRGRPRIDQKLSGSTRITQVD